MALIGHELAAQLLHNRNVVVIGDSIQRSVYKDLVLLLQRDECLSNKQLRSKGELSFESDALVEGGCGAKMHNGTGYREVRQFRSQHHLVRFYFVTRVFSRYMQSVLEDLRRGPRPDMVVVNSCIWDISRYQKDWEEDYTEHLHRFFRGLKDVLPRETLVVWNLTMPLGSKIRGGFLTPEVACREEHLRFDVVEANFCSGVLADAYGSDVLDLHFNFRFSLQQRTRDGIHWNALAHRRMSLLMLRHAAAAWGVRLPDSFSPAPQVPRKVNFNCRNDNVVQDPNVEYQQGFEKDKQPIKALEPAYKGQASSPHPAWQDAYGASATLLAPDVQPYPSDQPPSRTHPPYVMRKRHAKRRPHAPYGQRPGRDAPYGQRRDAAYGQRPGRDAPYGQRRDAAYGQRPGRDAPYGQRPDAAYGQRRDAAYGQRPGRDAPYGQRRDAAYGQRRDAAYGQRPGRDAPYGQRRDAAYGQRPGRDAPYGQRRDAAYGQRRDAAYGQRPGRDAPYGQRRDAAYGQRPGRDAAYGQRPGREAAYGQRPGRDAAYGQLGDAAYGQRPGQDAAYSDRPQHIFFP